MRLIKKYDNRKLYDTTTSKTLTLREIASIIRDGEEVKVVDGSDKDITNKVMAQIFLQENLETKQLVLSKFLLEWLIKESGKLENLTKKVLLGSAGLVSLTQEKADQLVTELIKRGEIEEHDKNKLVAQVIDRVEKSSKDFKSMVEGLVQDVALVKDKNELIPTKEQIIAEKEREIEALKKQIQELSNAKLELKEEEKNTKKSVK
jgi:polyhydroxyalkanoate synthesis repressor PhaR